MSKLVTSTMYKKTLTLKLSICQYPTQKEKKMSIYVWLNTFAVYIYILYINTNVKVTRTLCALHH